MSLIGKNTRVESHSADQTDLDKLQELLLGDQLTRISKLEKRLDRPDQRSLEIAEHLPSAIKQASENNPDVLQESLSESVEKTIFQRVRAEPESFAEALYPAILPAIRKAIHDAISTTMEQIDETLKTRFSTQSLRWRYEAMRTGTPLPAIILRESSPFAMDQVLLIKNGSGLLMDHRYNSSSKEVDRDAVSGMLWAIESFVRDAFSSESDGLNRVTTGSHILYLIHGRLATLVCVCQGVAPLGVLDKAKDTLSKIESHEHEALSNFEGDYFGIAGAQDHLDHLISVSKPIGPEKTKIKKRSRWPVIAVLTLVALLVSALAWRFVQHKEINAIAAELNGVEGVRVFTVSRIRGVWKLSGVADPAAGPMSDSIKTQFISKEKIVLDLLPINSAAPALMARKLAASLSIPKTAQWVFDKGRLKISGNVPPDWYYSITTKNIFPASTVGVDTRGVTVSEKTLSAYLGASLSGLEEVRITPLRGVIRLSGSISAINYRQLNTYKEIFQSKVMIDDSKLLIKNTQNGAG